MHFEGLGSARLTYVLGINLVACFFEGGFGFGGSLFFLTMSVPLLGWSESICVDAILATVNLLFVSWLYRSEIHFRDILFRPLLLAFGPVFIGAYIYHFLSPELRVIPLLLIGTCLMWKTAPNAKTIYPILSGFGTGLSNNDAPFAYLYFQTMGKGIGNVAIFTASLLILKFFFLFVVGEPIVIMNGWILVALILTGIPSSLLGKLFFDRCPENRRAWIVRVFLIITMFLLVLGVWVDS